MKVIPTSREEWSAMLLFPFKAYSVLGILAFCIFDRMYHHYDSHAWHLYGQVGGCIMIGYFVSAAVLFVGGCIQTVLLKMRSVTSSFTFGIVDVAIGFILPAFFPA
jgi:hypothetical protein